MITPLPRFGSTTIVLRDLPVPNHRSTQMVCGIDRIELTLDKRPDVFLQHTNVSNHPLGSPVWIGESNDLVPIKLKRQLRELQTIPNQLMSALRHSIILSGPKGKVPLVPLNQVVKALPSQITPDYRVALAFEPIKTVRHPKRITGFQVMGMTVYFPNLWQQVPYAEYAKVLKPAK